jgi:hypothetical protein
MQGGPQLATSVLLLVSMGLFSAGCGSSDKASVTRSLSSGGSNNSAGTGGSAANTGNSTSGGTGGSGTGGGSSISLSGGSSGTSGSSGSSGTGDGTTCGGDDYAGMGVPLDLYVMLDRSSSMLDAVNGTSKWDAITKALTTFFSDPASSGIGIGLQFFPYPDPNIPASCNVSADCGANNLCLKNFCQNAGPGIAICDTNADCVLPTTSGRTQNLGPCTPLTYCWSSHGSTLCHDDSDCNNVRGDCVPFNQCSNDDTYSCKAAGTMCGTDMGKNLGTCEAVTTSVCQHTSDCRSATYASPAAEIATLPGAAAGLQNVLMSTMPLGDTPTSPALGGAIAHAQAWAKAHPDHKVAVLLATDGLPSDCMVNSSTTDPYGLVEVTTTTAAGLAANPSIETFVIGVFAPSDTDSPGNLNQIAKAGGSGTAFVVNTGSDVEQQFLAALEKIRGTGIPCAFQIPTPTTGTFEPGLVNVVFKDGSQAQTLDYWQDAASCDATSGGWYYDNPTNPTKILACPASCSVFQNADSSATVAINLGCKTLVK